MAHIMVAIVDARVNAIVNAMVNARINARVNTTVTATVDVVVKTSSCPADNRQRNGRSTDIADDHPLTQRSQRWSTSW